jgi:hypothetical protein
MLADNTDPTSEFRFTNNTGMTAYDLEITWTLTPGGSAITSCSVDSSDFYPPDTTCAINGTETILTFNTDSGGVLNGDSDGEFINYTGTGIGTTEDQVVWTFTPEPRSLVLLATGLLAMALLKRKRLAGWNPPQAARTQR